MTILQGLLFADEGSNTVEAQKSSPGHCRRGNWTLGLAVLDTLNIMLCSVPIQEVGCGLVLCWHLCPNRRCMN